jgi:hypothetical protein
MPARRHKLFAGNKLKIMRQSRRGRFSVFLLCVEVDSCHFAKWPLSAQALVLSE